MESSQVKAKATKLSVDHVMASSALPFFFPAVSIDDIWYGDGGIRLNAPLSPAMHLGASKILAVSPRVIPRIKRTRSWLKSTHHQDRLPEFF